jgi:anti-sigma factor RsiW
VDCRDVQPLLHAYCDGELDLLRHLQVEHHLVECAECAERERGLRLLQTALASAPLYYRAPEALRTRLQGDSAPSPPRPAGRRWSTFALAATAAGIVLVLAATLTAGMFWSSAAAEDRLADQVVAGHIRSLQVASHTTDVTDSNQHKVKPWFMGKLDFAPQVVDLSPNGYTLTGGRLDYLTDRPVAALVYRRRQHVINVFTWPAEGNSSRGKEQTVRSLHRQGFHIRSWQQMGMAYWVISDLNPQELDDFVRLLREHAPPTAP